MILTATSFERPSARLSGRPLRSDGPPAASDEADLTHLPPARRADPVEDIIAASFGAAPHTLDDTFVALDDEDLIRVRAGQIGRRLPVLGYANSVSSAALRRTRAYACCATDALGLAPMVGEPVEIGSSCHHCGDPLKFAVTPREGRAGRPRPDGLVRKRGDDGCKGLLIRS